MKNGLRLIVMVLKTAVAASLIGCVGPNGRHRHAAFTWRFASCVRGARTRPIGSLATSESEHVVGLASRRQSVGHFWNGQSRASDGASREGVRDEDSLQQYLEAAPEPGRRCDLS